MIPGIRICLGVLVLLWGRRLYWIMVGVGGLLAGLEFTEQVLAAWSPPARLLVALGAGAVGVLLAILTQRVAFALLGFFGGGFVALVLTQSTTGNNTPLIWFLFAGVVGAVIATLVMDWAIIVLTSLAGAAAIAMSLAVGPTLQTVLFVILAGVGIAFQSQGFRRNTPQPDALSEPSTPKEREP